MRRIELSIYSLLFFPYSCFFSLFSSPFLFLFPLSPSVFFFFFVPSKNFTQAIKLREMDRPMTHEEWLAEEDDAKLMEDGHQRQLVAGKGKPARRSQLYLKTLDSPQSKVLKVG